MSQPVKRTNAVLDEYGGDEDVAVKRSFCYFTTRQNVMQLPDDDDCFYYYKK